jgi:hypothetical protein
VHMLFDICLWPVSIFAVHDCLSWLYKTT